MTAIDTCRSNIWNPLSTLISIWLHRLFELTGHTCVRLYHKHMEFCGNRGRYPGAQGQPRSGGLRQVYVDLRRIERLVFINRTLVIRFRLKRKSFLHLPNTVPSTTFMNWSSRIVTMHAGCKFRSSTSTAVGVVKCWRNRRRLHRSPRLRLSILRPGRRRRRRRCPSHRDKVGVAAYRLAISYCMCVGLFEKYTIITLWHRE